MIPDDFVEEGEGGGEARIPGDPAFFPSLFWRFFLFSSLQHGSCLQCGFLRELAAVVGLGGRRGLVLKGEKKTKTSHL